MNYLKLLKLTLLSSMVFITSSNINAIKSNSGEEKQESSHRSKLRHKFKKHTIKNSKPKNISELLENIKECISYDEVEDGYNTLVLRGHENIALDILRAIKYNTNIISIKNIDDFKVVFSYLNIHPNYLSEIIVLLTNLVNNTDDCNKELASLIITSLELDKLFRNINIILKVDTLLENYGYKIIVTDASYKIAHQIIRLVKNKTVNEYNTKHFLSRFFEFKLHPDNLNEIVRKLNELSENNSYEEIGTLEKIIQSLDIMGSLSCMRAEYRKSYKGIGLLLYNIKSLVTIHKVNKEGVYTTLISQGSKDIALQIMTLVNDGIIDETNVSEFALELHKLNIHPNNTYEIVAMLKTYFNGNLNSKPISTIIASLYLDTVIGEVYLSGTTH